MKRVLVWTLAMASLTGLKAGNFTVCDGRSTAQIVRPADAKGEETRAYEELARCLQLATGTAFRVYSEDAQAARIRSAAVRRIYVGRVKALPEQDVDALATMDRDAFLVHVTEREVFLVGPRPWSTYWAVCRFLEDQVGVRWLIPGPLGEDIPRHVRLKATTGRTIHTPDFLSRLWSGANYGGIWNLRQRIHPRYAFHHNLNRVFSAEDYDDHPEWFPLRGGKRYRPGGPTDHSWQPCFASASSVEHAAATARAAWDQNPDLESFSFGCNDGQGWCECDGCKAMDLRIEPWQGFEGTYSGRYYTWLNKVAEATAKTHPDRLLGCLAYSTYILPPEKIGLHPNIIPYFTSNRADYFDRGFRGRDQALLERWGRIADQMGIYDYAYGMGFAIPRIYSRLLQGALRHARGNGVTGFYAEVYPNWGLDGPKLYVMARLLWDVDANVGRIVRDWNRRMFREAAEPMAKYFALCERAWKRQNTGPGRWAYRLAADPKQFEVFPMEILERCTRYLDEAEARARQGVVRQRIRFFRKTWDVTLLLAENYWAARDMQILIDRQAPLSEIAVALRTMADRVAATDVDRFMEEKVGDDPVAFYPPKQSWITPLKSGASTQALRWSASRISRLAIRDALAAQSLSAEGLRKRIAQHIETAFGSGGSDAYRVFLDRLRALASKVVTAARVQAPPAVDGDLSDACWRGADVLTDFSRWGEVTAAGYRTEAKLIHDGTDLFVALDCRQDTSKLKVDAAARDGSTWKDDSVEIFINPGLEEFPHVQFIINAKGAFFDQWAREEGQTYRERLAANFGCEWRTKIEPGRWTAEIRIPLREFGFTPSSRAMLRINAVRNVQTPGKEEISAWFSSLRAHADPLSRGWVVFE